MRLSTTDRMGASNAVLVVDDDSDFRETVCATLRDEGIDAVGVSNGRLALEWLTAHEAALILLDLVMPDMNGWEFQATLEGDPELSRVPVLVISDHTAGGIQAGRAGVHFTLRKPFRIEDLLAHVEPYVRREH